ncbi:MAG TPA: indolepyruvate oxidoreductase subunit beta [Sporomusaceae bacterium]|uniref:indolepyruvate oxidoreductase subunit beta n=1 Tax=Anaerospora sp. TaxID=1960278 RepID=UPI000EDFD82A|nr:indolepyruvate oxidoreductase subunit beta [Anaerospora sp.]HAK73157.1 indolepyruvate oxidoreductase subunit beta [Sporomusaceae bacterium]
MADVKNILLVGVGGQGTILVGKILSNGLMDAGYDVKMSEVHGMAQRGGSVSNQVRYGRKVFSPIIGKGQADILVSFEAMEALRWLEYLKPGGKAVVNDHRIPSAPILIGKSDYPEGVLDIMQSKVDTAVINAAQIAEQLGNAKTMNIVLFGALVRDMNLTGIDWEAVIRKNVKVGLADINIAAFQAGMNS